MRRGPSFFTTLQFFVFQEACAGILEHPVIPELLEMLAGGDQGQLVALLEGLQALDPQELDLIVEGLQANSDKQVSWGLHMVLISRNCGGNKNVIFVQWKFQN